MRLNYRRKRGGFEVSASMIRILVVGTAVLVATAARSEPMVLFQSMYNLSYAEGVCSFVTSAPGETFASSEAKSQCASQTDAQFFGRRLEQAAQSNFAANPHCPRVPLITRCYPPHHAAARHPPLPAPPPPPPPP